MKGRYINIQILLACLSKKTNTSKDIHSQLEETIAEHRRVMLQFVTQTIAEADDSIEMHKRKIA